MLRRILLVIALMGMLVPTTGCSSNPIKLTIADNGRSLNVNVGEELVIDLEGNPSTGYTWEPRNMDGSFVQQVGETEFRSGNPGLIGASGTLTLTFKALKPGRTNLTLVYHRPWETDVQPLGSFDITLFIQ